MSQLHSLLVSQEKSVCHNDQENEMTVDNNDKESEKKTDCEDEKGEWTQVTRKKRKVYLPPCWKLRFPVHMRADLCTPSGSSSSSSGEESDSGSPPVAARTRSKLQT